MDRKGVVSGIVLILLAASLIATELARPQNPWELSGDVTRGTRGGVRSVVPPTSQPTIVLERPPTCTDGLRNGVETDVDCGGPVCPSCAIGKSCVLGTDCASQLCLSGLCLLAPVVEQPQAPSCTDGLKNGLETDIDCGGSCAPCDVGKACDSNVDCKEGRCRQRICSCASGAGSSCQPNACSQVGVINCDGSCSAQSAPLPQNFKQSCRPNECSDAGTIGCDGLCSAKEAPLPPNFKSSCQANACSPVGAIGCNGLCSAPTLALPLNFGKSCQPNVCSSVGTIGCAGTCSAPTIPLPTNFGASCGCDNKGTIGCSGSCVGGLQCASNQVCSQAKCCVSTVGTSCGCGGTTQCDGSCKDTAGNLKTSCASGQVCQNGNCIQQLKGQCQSCSANSECQSNICYFNQCVSQSPTPIGTASFPSAGLSFSLVGPNSLDNPGPNSMRFTKPVRPVRVDVKCILLEKRVSSIGFFFKGFLGGTTIFSNNLNCGTSMDVTRFGALGVFPLTPAKPLVDRLEWGNSRVDLTTLLVEVSPC